MRIGMRGARRSQPCPTAVLCEEIRSRGRLIATLRPATERRAYRKDGADLELDELLKRMMFLLGKMDCLGPARAPGRPSVAAI